jgi:predicted restriction endonuclease
MRKLVDALFSIDFSGDADGQTVAATTPENGPQSVETQREIIALARIGQTRFAQEVFARYDRRCAVSGIEAAELLQACHVKPWAEASGDERMDPNNGLCLAVHLHLAFDAHLLCVAPDGRIVLSERLTREDRERLKLHEGLQIEVTAKQRPYLEYRFPQFTKAQGVEGNTDA